jgi:hypothetical protein|tara:strand:- start:4378 stop:4536 length:159 start_codon:yes stop_codon:yes gene_type:complete
MALTKAEVEALVYRRKNLNDRRPYAPPTNEEQLTIRNTVQTLLDMIVVKHSA